MQSPSKEDLANGMKVQKYEIKKEKQPIRSKDSAIFEEKLKNRKISNEEGQELMNQQNFLGRESHENHMQHISPLHLSIHNSDEKSNKVEATKITVGPKKKKWLIIEERPEKDATYGRRKEETQIDKKKELEAQKVRDPKANG